MDLFSDDVRPIKAAVGYFNNLPDQDKITIVSDLNPTTFKLKRHFRPLFPLFSNVQQALSGHGGMVIGNRLVDLGLDDMYARIIVENMKKHAPTLEYQLSQISTLDDEAFSRLDEIINAVWIDNAPRKVVAEKYDITQEQIQAVVDIVTKMTVRLLRGDTNEKRILRDFAKKGLAPARTESVINILQEYKDTTYRNLMFSNTQDIHAKVEKLASQNEVMLSGIKTIIGLLKSKS